MALRDRVLNARSEQLAVVTTNHAMAARKWYLIYAKPRQEELAKVNLERQGYETYLPLMRTPRRRLGRRVIRIEPMFPRYLFIRLDKIHDNWAPIRSTFGVSKLVRFGSEPTPVPDDLIEALQTRDDKSGIQDRPLHEFKQGEAVRIEEGPFMGYQGIFLAKSSRERVIVLLNIVGKYAKATVDVAKLGPADA
ncbi:MAG: transcription/translation regulatory transformer protein RfaH [Gammaproteobacteria bacterium]|nr:transcription/translation regulatory transformer protein RfaH [Gammaproteobacteria bacterium]